jgi:NAD(P)-dependent dehydrogenase (short-subunit alcohol dehydrogenase family)
MRGLRRQTALVTAASMGIGAAIAAALADQRVFVSLVACGCDAHAAGLESCVGSLLMYPAATRN